MTVSGYTPPAVEGTTVTFHCPPGAVLHGINSSTCMENGEWEPAPFEINCLLTGINLVATHATQKFNYSTRRHYHEEIAYITVVYIVL